MPYLTPDEIPEDDACRPLSIPASSEWLAIVSGALTELTKAWNWEQKGAVTVDEAVARMQEMVDAYYDGCAACTIPGGSPLFRLNPATGEIEELMPDGTWGAPTGDYELPPTPQREEGTASERKCLAAANAANVLQILYESLSDSFSDGLAQDEAAAAIVAIIAGAIGSVFGIVVAPLIIIAALLFGVVYATVEFVTADLWDSTFTEKLVCVLLGCATESGDVVHFDLPCVLDQLAHGTDVLDPTTSELRLFGQIYTILSMLGAQALDAAGATTAITDYSCDEACLTWCYTFDFSEGLSGWSFVVDGSTVLGTEVGTGLQSVYDHPGTGYRIVAIARTFSANIDHIEMTFEFTPGTCNSFGDSTLYVAGNAFIFDQVTGCITPISPSVYDGVGHDVTSMFIQLIAGSNTSNADPGGVALMKTLTLSGRGANPFGEDNCL